MWSATSHRKEIKIKMKRKIYVLTIVDESRCEIVLNAFEYYYQAINRILDLLNPDEQIVFLSDNFARSFSHDIKSNREYKERGYDYVYECDWDWEYEIREVELEEPY